MRISSVICLAPFKLFPRVEQFYSYEEFLARDRRQKHEEQKDHERLRVDFGKLIEFTSISGKYGGGSAMRAMKPLMNAFGLPGGTLRPPRMPISDADLQEVINAVLKIDIAGTPPLLKR